MRSTLPRRSADLTLSVRFICRQGLLLADCSQSVRNHTAAYKLTSVLCGNAGG